MRRILSMEAKAEAPLALACYGALNSIAKLEIWVELVRAVEGSPALSEESAGC